MPWIAHEHIYWDQASVLVQIGLIKEKKYACYRDSTSKANTGFMQKLVNS